VPRTVFLNLNIGLIWAQAHGGVIGLNGQMPWHLPEDLAHFKRVTANNVVLMGRKTWESLPLKFRPLPGRRNLVLSRDAEQSKAIESTGGEVFKRLEDALERLNAEAQSAKTVWVIGGAQIYAQAIHLAKFVVVTNISATFAGDAFAPKLGEEWHETNRSGHVNGQGLQYEFVYYNKVT
jgi:dihydrofolate reductase